MNGNRDGGNAYGNRSGSVDGNIDENVCESVNGNADGNTHGSAYGGNKQEKTRLLRRNHTPQWILGVWILIAAAAGCAGAAGGIPADPAPDRPALVETGPLTETSPLTDTGPLTKTDSLTDTAPLTDTSPLTDTGALMEADPASAGEASGEKPASWFFREIASSPFMDDTAAARFRGDGTPLTAAELGELRERLAAEVESRDERGFLQVSTTPVSCFFTSWYADPRDLDLGAFLRNCPAGEGVTDEREFQAFAAVCPWIEAGASLSDLPAPLRRFRAEAVDALLREYAGITLSDLRRDWRAELVFLPEYAAFYDMAGDYCPGIFFPVYGERKDGVLTLYSAAGDTLRIQETEGRILSHLPAAGDTAEGTAAENMATEGAAAENMTTGDAATGNAESLVESSAP